jgi:cold shock CspA family protein
MGCEENIKLTLSSDRSTFMDISSRNAATIHEVLKLIRDALTPFLLECLNEKHPSLPQWWDAVDLRRQGEELRVLPRNPLKWLPDETLKTVDDHWGAFSRKTKRRFISPREKPAADEVPQGWVKHLREFRNRTMHQDEITDKDLSDFIRVAEWLLTAARADEAVQTLSQLLEEVQHPNSGVPVVTSIQSTHTGQEAPGGDPSSAASTPHTPTPPKQPPRKIVVPRPLSAEEKAERVRAAQQKTPSAPDGAKQRANAEADRARQEDGRTAHQANKPTEREARPDFLTAFRKVLQEGKTAQPTTSTPLKYTANASFSRTDVKGFVKWFNHEEGLGIIVQDDDENEVWVTIETVERSGAGTLRQNQCLYFNVVNSTIGQEAVYLRLIWPKAYSP